MGQIGIFHKYRSKQIKTGLAQIWTDNTKGMTGFWASGESNIDVFRYRYRSKYSQMQTAKENMNRQHQRHDWQLTLWWVRIVIDRRAVSREVRKHYVASSDYLLLLLLSLHNFVKITDSLFCIIFNYYKLLFHWRYAEYEKAFSGKISNVVCSQLAMMLQVFDRPESHSELPVDSNEPMIVQTVHKWTFLCVRCRVLLWTSLPFNSGPGRGFRHKQGP